MFKTQTLNCLSLKITTQNLLVLVVDERGSFSAIDAHIFPCLVQTVLEDVD